MERKLPIRDAGLIGRGEYYIETFGCQMNVRDSETVAGLLENLGYSRAENRENADVILFNTCCVRDHAEKRVFGNIGALKELKDERPNLILGVFGLFQR